jgi:hypothetical protein
MQPLQQLTRDLLDANLLGLGQLRLRLVSRSKMASSGSVSPSRAARDISERKNARYDPQKPADAFSLLNAVQWAAGAQSPPVDSAESPETTVFVGVLLVLQVRRTDHAPAGSGVATGFVCGGRPLPRGRRLRLE